MAFDVIDFFNDFGVNYRTEGHKHTQQGWVNMPCPFCTGNPGWHLGYAYFGDFFNCWRCGFHSCLEVVHEISGTNWGKAKDLLREYQTHKGDLHQRPRKIAQATTLKLPHGTRELEAKELRYLARRGFDPGRVTDLWELKATGPTGDYKHRLIAPIQYNTRLISYQGRDITEKQRLKYKACPIEEEVIHHKEVLYGLDLISGREAILVEGITDAWRIGVGAVCSFGIKLKSSQILLLAEKFSRVYIMFDDDPQALEEAKKISTNLSVVGVESEVCIIDGDPGDLPQKTADQYKRQLIG